MNTTQTDRTSVGLSIRVKEKFDEAKPGGLSANEFVDVLVDHWKGDQ